MTDNIDDLAKRALGEPPEDPEARARALATLRAQITAAGASSASKGHQIRAVVALGVAVATIVLLVAIVPSSTPAAALEALGSRPPRIHLLLWSGVRLSNHTQRCSLSNATLMCRLKRHTCSTSARASTLRQRPTAPLCGPRRSDRSSFQLRKMKPPGKRKEPRRSRNRVT